MHTEEQRLEIESAIKELIKDRIGVNLTDQDIKNRGIATFDAINSYLTDIMALGYNNKSIELSTNDIFEIQSQLPWLSITKADISKRLEFSLLKFQNEINCFIIMLASLSMGKDKKTILEEVKNALY